VPAEIVEQCGKRMLCLFERHPVFLDNLLTLQGLVAQAGHHKQRLLVVLLHADRGNEDLTDVGTALWQRISQGLPELRRKRFPVLPDIKFAGGTEPQQPERFVLLETEFLFA